MVLFPVETRDFFSSPNYPDRLWAPSRFLVGGAGGTLPGYMMAGE